MSLQALTWAYDQHPAKIDDKGNVVSDRNAPAKSVLVALANFADSEGKAYPSQSVLSDMTHYKGDTLRRALHQLRDQGFIEIEERTRENGSKTSPRYWLQAPEQSLIPQTKDGVQNTVKTPQNEGGHPSERGGAPLRARGPYTQEDTQEDTFHSRGARTRARGREPNQNDLEESKEKSSAKKERKEPAGNTDVADLVSVMAMKGYELDPEEKKRCGAAFKRLRKKGATDEQVNLTIFRMVERRHAFTLSPERAYSDVTGQEQQKGGEKPANGKWGEHNKF